MLASATPPAAVIATAAANTMPNRIIERSDGCSQQYGISSAGSVSRLLVTAAESYRPSDEEGLQPGAVEPAMARAGVARASRIDPAPCQRRVKTRLGIFGCSSLRASDERSSGTALK